MVKIVWTELSLSDLAEIHDYIALDSSRYATITVAKVYDSVQLLEGKPLLGRMVPEFRSRTIRELMVGHYRIIYRTSGKEKIEILRIIHDARLLKRKHIK
jgi:toxin ParE1/3/4